MATDAGPWSTALSALPPDTTDLIKGPGILFVRSRIAQSAKDILDEQTFLKWYDEEHVPEVVATSGIKSGFRYVSHSYLSSPYSFDVMLDMLT